MPGSTCVAVRRVSPSSRIRIFSGRTVKRAPVALEHVRDADEAGDELGRRALVDLGGRADLLDPAVVEDREAVAHRERLLLVVRHVDERDADLALDALELDLHLLAQLEVERAERLVEQQQPRAVDDRARERDALALAAGELGRLARAVAARRTISSASLARRRRSALATLLIRSPYSTFSRTVMCGNSA